MAEPCRAGILRQLCVSAGQQVHGKALLQAGPGYEQHPCMSLGPNWLCRVCLGLSRVLPPLWRGMLLPSTSTMLRPKDEWSKPR